MSRTIKNVALAGPTGNVGTEVLKALLETKKFAVTVLVRRPGGSFPENVSVKVVDFASVPALSEAVRGQDAVVDARPSGDGPALVPLIDAAAASGVYRYVPTEYGMDPARAGVHDVPVWQGKGISFRQVVEKAEESTRGGGDFTWTAVASGPFLDWGLGRGFLGLDLKARKVTLYGDGDNAFAYTTLPSVGRAVAGLLLAPEATSNRVVYVHDVVKSQRELFAVARRALGEDGWEVGSLGDVGEVDRRARAELAAGSRSMRAHADVIRCVMANKELATTWPRDDDALLGLEGWSDEKLGGFMRETAAALA